MGLPLGPQILFFCRVPQT